MALTPLNNASFLRQPTGRPDGDAAARGRPAVSTPAPETTARAPLPSETATPEQLARQQQRGLAATKAYDDAAPAETLYATVRAGAEVIAEIANSGAVTSRGSALTLGGPDERGLLGPELAAHRADKIATAYGAKVEMAATAQTQEQYEDEVTARALAPRREVGAYAKTYQSGEDAAWWKKDV
ncbi:hypothetical protein P7B02_00310 [Caulobacter segnis]|uniref:hypothetical protein n=1 Tax=Caulobacter segnis TaxID=88688 RepID=UPI0024107409|nr:hypothetical protein [Caulobacter segnis]MDG2519963.1 hypothetical protein [Caulobacter segnis]